MKFQKAVSALKFYKGYRGNNEQEDCAIAREFEKLKLIAKEQKREEKVRASDYCKTLSFTHNKNHQTIDMFKFLDHREKWGSERFLNQFRIECVCTIHSKLHDHKLCSSDFPENGSVYRSIHVIDNHGCGTYRRLTSHNSFGWYSRTENFKHHFIARFSAGLIHTCNISLPQYQWLRFVCVRLGAGCERFVCCFLIICWNQCISMRLQYWISSTQGLFKSHFPKNKLIPFLSIFDTTPLLNA